MSAVQDRGYGSFGFIIDVFAVALSRRAPADEGVFNRLATLRKTCGCSRRTLAEAVGVNPQTIGYLERGDYAPSLDLAMRLAGHFAVPVEAVFSFEPFDGTGDPRA